MYHHVHGELVVITPVRAVVEAGGVGYELSIPFSTYGPLAERLGESVRLLTHFLVREDSFRLFGFLTEPERALFRAVVRVSGLGPAAALTILSTFHDIAEFRRVIDAGDPRPLERVKGIGKKIASRLIVELRDGLDALAVASGAGAGSRRDPPSHLPSGATSIAGEAEHALVEIGYDPNDARTRVEAAWRSLEGERDAAGQAPGDPSATLTVERLLREALRLN